MSAYFLPFGVYVYLGAIFAYGRIWVGKDQPPVLGSLGACGNGFGTLRDCGTQVTGMA